jgi:hypothetical protein
MNLKQQLTWPAKENKYNAAAGRATEEHEPPEEEETDRVYLAWVHTGTVHEPFARSIAEACLWKPNNIIGITTAGGPRQEAQRNTAIKAFLEIEGDLRGDWLMWIDTDMTFEHDAIERLLATAHATGADAVGALGFIWNPVNAEITTNAYIWDAEEKVYKHIRDYERNTIALIDATGSGSVLIHRRVFELWDNERWHETWPVHPDSGTLMGHDLAFFHKAIHEHGMKLVWDASVHTGHIKSFELTEANYEAYREQA